MKFVASSLQQAEVELAWVYKKHLLELQTANPTLSSS